MGQLLHGRARTTHSIRKEIQSSSSSVKDLAILYNLTEKTVRKWKNRTSVEDIPCGVKPGQMTVLRAIEERIIVETKLKTLLPLGDLYALLKPIIPILSMSNLHRCLTRHGISNLRQLIAQREGQELGKKPIRKDFKSYEIGYVHIDTSQVMVGKQKYYLFVAIDRCSRYAHVSLRQQKTMQEAESFLTEVISAFPFKIQKILTDNGMEFCYNALIDSKKPVAKLHPFQATCRLHQIEHRTTLFKHPWTNGMVEAMNKKIKNNTTHKYKYENAKQLSEHLFYYQINYNFNLKLSALKQQTPFQQLKQKYLQQPNLFNQQPQDLLARTNTTCFYVLYVL